MIDVMKQALVALCSADPIGHALEDYEYHNKATEALRQAIEQAEKQEPINKMPTKIFGPNLEQILNAAGFYRRDAVCCGDYEKCIEPCTPKGEWLAKKELMKPEQAEYDKLTVKFGERAKEYLEAAKKSWQPEQRPVAWCSLVEDRLKEKNND